MASANRAIGRQKHLVGDTPAFIDALDFDLKSAQFLPLVRYGLMHPLSQPLAGIYLNHAV